MPSRGARSTLKGLLFSIYILSAANGLQAEGTLSTVAGSSNDHYVGDGGQATDAEMRLGRRLLIYRLI